MSNYKIGDITTWKDLLSINSTVSVIINSDTRKDCLIRVLSNYGTHYLSTTHREKILLTYE